jgi:hypothetical protein
MRTDQLEALYERWGGTPGTDKTVFGQPATQQLGSTSLVSGPNPVFPWCQMIAKGVPFQWTERQVPALFLTITDVEERRQAAQKKWITYTLRCVLMTLVTAQTATSDRAPALLLAHWAQLDDLGRQIRGLSADPAAKILTTQAAPTGLFDPAVGNASIKFGEHVTVHTEWGRVENDLTILSVLDIESVEQVNA